MTIFSLIPDDDSDYCRPTGISTLYVHLKRELLKGALRTYLYVKPFPPKSYERKIDMAEVENGLKIDYHE